MATSAANMLNPRATSVSPALIRSIGRNCGQSDLISETSTSFPSSAWAEFSSMALSVARPATMVNGTKDPVTRAEFDCQAALGLETFLSLRATELRPGGRFVVDFPHFLMTDRPGSRRLLTTRTRCCQSWSSQASSLPKSEGG